MAADKNWGPAPSLKLSSVSTFRLKKSPSSELPGRQISEVWSIKSISSEGEAAKNRDSILSFNPAAPGLIQSILKNFYLNVAEIY